MPAEVRIANSLTTARHACSEQQLNLFFCLLTKLKKVPAVDRCYQVSRAEVEQLSGKKINSSNLAQQAIAMQDDYWECGSPSAPQQLRLFERVAYQKGRGVIDFTLSVASLPFLFNLTGNFTSFDLATALRIRGSYSKRLYLLCAQWRDRSATPEYKLDYLRWMFALTDKTLATTDKYKLFGHLHLRILKPAIEQLNAQTNFKVELAIYKQALTVTKIKLHLRAVSSTQHAVTSPPATGFSSSLNEQQLRVISALQKLGIIDRSIHQKVIDSDYLIYKTFNFVYKLKIGGYANVRNQSGLLLMILGIK